MKVGVTEGNPRGTAETTPINGRRKTGSIKQKTRQGGFFVRYDDKHKPQCFSSQPVIIALMCASGVWPVVVRYT